MSNLSPDRSAQKEKNSHFLSRTQVVILGVIGLLLAICVSSAWFTQDSVGKLPSSAGSTKGRGATPKAIVDVSSWQTAEALAQLAYSAEEKDYAEQAERLADHSVDQAFAAAIRVATLSAQNRQLTGDAKAVADRIDQLQLQVAQDQSAVKQLAAARAGTKSGAEDADDTDLQVAKAQLQLDSDELSDAQEDLARATGDERPQIQSELSAHEAQMKSYDNQTQAPGQLAALSVGQYGTLARRVGAWNRQRTRAQLLDQAGKQAESNVRALSAMHNALETKAGAAGNGTAPAQDQASRLARLQSRSIERQLLSIYDDRIQTEQQLANVYKKWGAHLQVQHRIVLHLIFKSLAWVLAMGACMVIAIAVLRRAMEHPLLDVRQRHTLRSILELCIQIIGAVCILLVIFGPPRQLGAMLGLGTAALTVALQDFILAFFGWFILIGKKGMRVGDIVEIDGVGGEVLEIGLMSTTLLETGTLAEQGYPTGRRVTFMNSFAVKHKYFNFSSTSQWMWDQFDVALPSTEKTHLRAEQILGVLTEATAGDVQLAEREWRGARVPGLTDTRALPSVNLRPSGNEFKLQVHYITRASDRFETRNRLYQRVIDLLQMPLDSTTGAQSGSARRS
ncbi:mechanosensitive ion channel domain-containing protein [Occallatibacter riparius]|uniref:Mechanosensitive ion channel n=1 Tax=Occallatibacter riparius TaxID=1002689 RepID=A0A9J7BR92_9BACT|nr:mechanosensitive ion channel domain-containing protein [Occallatibacter riparius]UWZ85097.1 mechanosensitive ion channel [Occallatibacter riparius]